MATTKATNLGHRSDVTLKGTTTTIETDVVVSDTTTINNAGSDVGLKINSESTGHIMQLQDSGTDVMVVEDGGNVGIGVNGSDSKLQVATTQFDPSLARTTASILVRSESGSTTGDGEYSGAITFGKIDSSRPFGSIAGVQIGSDADGGGLAFFTKNGTSTNDIVGEAMRIDSGGNIGIGIDSPSYKLETKDGDISAVTLGSASGGTSVNGIRFRINNSGSPSQFASLGKVSAETESGWGGSLIFSTKPANGSPNESVTEAMRIDSSGHVHLPSQPFFFAKHTTTETPSSGNTIASWTTVVNNGGGTFSSGVYTVPADGQYLVNASILFDNSNSATPGGWHIRKNTSDIYRGSYGAGSDYVSTSGTCIVDCGDGDTISIIQENSNVTWYGDPSGIGNFTIVKIA